MMSDTMFCVAIEATPSYNPASALGHQSAALKRSPVASRHPHAHMAPSPLRDARVEESGGRHEVRREVLPRDKRGRQPHQPIHQRLQGREDGVRHSPAPYTASATASRGRRLVALANLVALLCGLVFGQQGRRVGRRRPHLGGAGGRTALNS